MGYTKISEIIALLNLKGMKEKTFKRYEDRLSFHIVNYTENSLNK